MRNSDANKVMRSFTTVWNQAKQRWELKEETWVPGYTESHKATKTEALKYRVEMLHIEQRKLARQVNDLDKQIHDIFWNNEEKN